jgi:hypothetical protein
MPLSQQLLRENSHDYASGLATKSKDFSEKGKDFKEMKRNERLKKINSFTKPHALFH